MKNILLLAVLSFAATPLAAGVIYTNLGAGDSYSGLAYTSENVNGPFSLATVFTASASGNLQQILTPIADVLGSMTFDLYADSGGQPGTLLEQWTNVTVPTDTVDSLPLTTLTSVANPFLTSGDIYWFEVTSAETGTGLAWGANDQGVPGGLWLGGGSASPSTMFTPFVPDEATPAIELDSPTATPEPGTWILFASGLALVAARRAAVVAKSR